MLQSPLFKPTPIALAVALVWLPAHSALAQQAATETTLSEVQVLGTAEETLKQAPGVSIITSEDIEKRPPANDLSDIIRRMPGVNLTGNSATGQRGNNRQIDLRGMGPENTLILIDGKPVTSRNSVRYGRSGERDTRGDSNWVPVEEVDSIEVIRGPAAARYGSGSAGGVVNIITKGIPKEARASVSLYANQPEHDEEGTTRRINVTAAGPMGEQWGYRVYANYNKTDADDSDINIGETVAGGSTAAGREGVINKDLKALLRWMPISGQTLDFEASYSRQGNIYAGDTGTGASATSSSTSAASAYLGKETNAMTRRSYALTHKGDWSFGTTNTFFQYENTQNRRLDEGLVGSTEGNINSAQKQTSELDGYTFHSELNAPLKLGVNQVLTMGVEWNYQKLDDPATVTNASIIAGFPGLADNAADRKTDNDATMTSIFVEDNIELTSNLILTPGLRLDHHSEFGNNWSPSLNASYMLTSEITLKGGIARAFKAPNLYQTHPSYMHYSTGNGCNKTIDYTVRCYVLGNADLDPEISINKELGFNWTRNGWSAGLTWFRNDYDNKIVGGTDLIGIVSVSGADRYVYRWENATDAVVEGYEGNLLIPLAHNINWTNNFTYMRRNDDQNGEPLSIIPKYTVNTTLDWQATDKLSLVLTGTFYGKQKPRETAYNTGLSNTGAATNSVDPYNIWGISAGYTFTRNWKGRVGVSNLFDKRLFREANGSGAGASSYNEPGRAYYATLTASF